MRVNGRRTYAAAAPGGRRQGDLPASRGFLPEILSLALILLIQEAGGL